MICVKGATVTEAIGKDRLLYPMMRDSLNQPFRRASWDEALERVVNQIVSACYTQGADALCMYGSGQSATEDYYVAQKLMKGCLGTNNFDSNSRLCMASAVTGYFQSLGSDGPPCCYDDLDLTDCAFLIGTNAAECHPILFNRLQKHHKKHSHVKMVVVDPRRTPTAESADLHLAIKPGTDIDLLNGMAHLLLRWEYIDANFIDDCTANFPIFAEVIRHYPPEVVAERCGITITDLETAARYWGESKRVLSMWLLGLNQSREGTAKVQTLINLHLMTGQIGKPGAGPFSLTGQPNAMGGREVGGNAYGLPGYRFVTNPQDRDVVEQFWELPTGQISAYAGRTAWDIITGLENEEVGFLWIVATNAVFSLPDSERTKAALRRSPFTVYQEVYYPTETAAYAHVLLPATQWSEKTCTMTNSERRVTLCTAFQSPPGEARDDWVIFAEVGRRLGFVKQFPFTNSAEVYAEFVQLTRDRPCDMTGISHERLHKEGPIQWPASSAECEVRSVELKEREETSEKNRNSPSELRTPNSELRTSKRLYTDLRFHTPDGRARFAGYHSRGLAEPPDPEYPFVLINGRLYGHWHSQTRTGRVEKIRQMYSQPFLEIHPRDAANLGIQDSSWVEVRSRRGRARFPIKITQAITPGNVFVPMHWGSLWADQAEVNALSHSEACPDSLQPEMKVSAVQLVPIAAELAVSESLLQPTQSRVSPPLSV